MKKQMPYTLVRKVEKPSYAPQREESNISEREASSSSSSSSYLNKKDALTITRFWEGYISGLQKLNGNQVSPLYSWGEMNISTTIQTFLKKADASIDPRDFAYSVTKHWTVVREYLDDLIEGFEPIANTPSLFTFRMYLSHLIVWYRDCYVANGRTTLGSVGIAYVPKFKWNYTPPKPEELPTKQDLLNDLIAAKFGH